MIHFLKKLIPADFFLRMWYHKCMTFFAALVYGFPARKLIVIGITGTDGKTTTSTLVYNILRESGLKTALTSTTHFAIGDKKWTNETHKTTLGRFYLQKMIAQMVKEQCTHLVLEVSSHALEQGRIIGIPIDVALITNMSREHLDFHKTFENYKKAKLKLFKKLCSSRKSSVPKTAIINIDDDTHIAIQNMGMHHILSYGIENKAYYAAKNIRSSKNGTLFTLVHNNKELEIKLQLIGSYNVYNALAAISVASVFDIEMTVIKKALYDTEGIGGRFEVVVEKDPIIIIDYAVTENAFEKLFTTARSMVGGKVISVFGSCGDRDKEKRPGLGKVASNLCDVCIVTDEEPYTEKPEKIRSMILEGIDQKKTECYEIVDRKNAIEKAISLASKEDIVLITGMGDQTSMIVGNKKLPWSDREVIKELFENK